MDAGLTLCVAAGANGEWHTARSISTPAAPPIEIAPRTVAANSTTSGAGSLSIDTREASMNRVYGVLALAVVSLSCRTETVPAAAPAPAAFTPQPQATLAQMMRGIPFTFANVVFDAQSEDPGAPRAPAEVGGGATATFKNVYGGWQEVENSALALAEAANLAMIPGRLCENGKPVPIHEETYRRAALGLAEAGRAAYKAAQSRSLDAMVEVSETVSIACSNCHEPYRDFDNPQDRCTAREGPRAGE
jgi:hypothetical protein